MLAGCPGLDLIEPRWIRDKPLLPRDTCVIGDGPAVKIGNPRGNQPPCLFIVWPDPSLIEQLGGSNSRLVDIAGPKICRKVQPLLERQLRPPAFGHLVDLRHRKAEILALDLVIGGRTCCALRICGRAEFG